MNSMGFAKEDRYTVHGCIKKVSRYLWGGTDDINEW